MSPTLATHMPIFLWIHTNPIIIVMPQKIHLNAMLLAYVHHQTAFRKHTVSTVFHNFYFNPHILEAEMST